MEELEKFIDELIDVIQDQGIYGDGYSDSEREEDVVNMIRTAYYRYINRENK